MAPKNRVPRSLECPRPSATGRSRIMTCSPKLQGRRKKHIVRLGGGQWMSSIDRRGFLAAAALAAASQARSQRKPLRVGVIAEGKSPDAAIGRVKELGCGNCQIHFGAGSGT